MPCLGYFSTGNVSLRITQEAGWALGPIWAGMENFACTSIQSLDCQPVESDCTDHTIPAPLCTDYSYQIFMLRQISVSLYGLADRELRLSHI
jgi:hypothetical protein